MSFCVKCQSRLGCTVHLTISNTVECLWQESHSRTVVAVPLPNCIWIFSGAPGSCGVRGATSQCLHTYKIPPMQKCLTSTTSCDRQFHSELSLHTPLFLASFPLLTHLLLVCAMKRAQNFFLFFFRCFYHVPVYISSFQTVPLLLISHKAMCILVSSFKVTL